MPRLIAITLVALVLAFDSSTATAQSGGAGTATLGAGTRIRVTAAPPVTATTGVVVSHTADTLVLRTDAHGNTIAVPVAQVTRLDVRGGPRTRKLLGASIGLLVGAGAGALVGQSSVDESSCTGSLVCGDSFAASGGAVVGGLAGLLVGTMAGSWSTERWNPVAGTPIAGARVGLTRVPGSGLALTTSLTF